MLPPSVQVHLVQPLDEAGPPHAGDRDAQGDGDRAEIIQPRGDAGLHGLPVELERHRVQREGQRRHTERHGLGRRGGEAEAAGRACLRCPQGLRPGQVDRIGDVEQAQRDDGAGADDKLGLAHAWGVRRDGGSVKP